MANINNLWWVVLGDLKIYSHDYSNVTISWYNDMVSWINYQLVSMAIDQTLWLLPEAIFQLLQILHVIYWLFKQRCLNFRILILGWEWMDHYVVLLCQKCKESTKLWLQYIVIYCSILWQYWIIAQPYWWGYILSCFAPKPQQKTEAM